MSDSQDKSSLPAKSSATNSVQSKIHICLLSAQPKLAQSIAKLLNCDRYEVKTLSLEGDAVNFLIENENRIECVVLLRDDKSESLLKQLWQSRVLLPAIIIETTATSTAFRATGNEVKAGVIDPIVDDLIASVVKPHLVYHQAEILLYLTQLSEIDAYINLAITKFLSLTSNTNINNKEVTKQPEQKAKIRNSLVSQQRRLTEKIKERLRYSKVCYKRQSNNFHRNLASDTQAQFYQELGHIYYKILLRYFDQDSKVNKLIDEFVDQAFFADISTSQILEMHMEMIDNFSYQLKIEGRNDDILLDYRLPLIDIISHLCELYRRSIPEENLADIALDLMFSVE